MPADPGITLPNDYTDPNAPPISIPTPPSLTQNWEVAPNLPGATYGGSSSSSGGGGGSGPTDFNEFTVNPGGIEEAENQILASTRSAISYYQSFSQQVKSLDGPLFEGPIWLGDRWKAVGAVEVAAQQAVQAQERVLEEVAAALDVVGTFIGSLDDAAQVYVSADTRSNISPFRDVSATATS